MKRKSEPKPKGEGEGKKISKFFEEILFGASTGK